MSELQKTEFRTRDRWLLLAFILGPFAALSDLGVAYTLVPTACSHGSKMMLHVTAITCLIFALAAALIGRHYHSEFDAPDSVLWIERTRWMATSSIILGIASAVIIIALEIPNVILRSCD
jgi:hypothetical protein